MEYGNISNFAFSILFKSLTEMCLILAVYKNIVSNPIHGRATDVFAVISFCRIISPD